MFIPEVVRRNWLALAALVWAAGVVALAIQGALQPHTRTVFDIYATAAKCWWAGEDMYVCRRDWYRYSPLFAVGVSPLAMMPAGLGNALWKVLNALVFVAGVWVWLRHVVPGPTSRAVLGTALLLTLPGSVHSLHNGQATLLATGLCFLALAAAGRDRWWLAAGLVAAATLVKGYPLALALLLSALHFRAFAWRYAAVLGVGLLTPFLFQSPGVVADQYASWFRHLTESSDRNMARQRAVDHLLRNLGCTVAPAHFLVLSELAGVAVLGLCLAHARQTPDVRDRLARMSLLYLVWVVLFGPATESCSYAVVAPVVGWLLADAVGRGAGLTERVALTAALVLCGPVTTDLFGPTVREVADLKGAQPVGGLILLACVLWRTASPLRSAGQGQDRVGAGLLARIGSVFHRGGQPGYIPSPVKERAP